MKKVLKFLSLLLVIVLCASLVFVIAACDDFSDTGDPDDQPNTPNNPNNPDNPNNPNTPTSSGKITIEFYSTMGKSLENVANKYIAEFEKQYPNIKVNHTVISGDYSLLVDRISKELSTNKGPSVAYCYPDHVAKYGLNKALVLDDYMNSTEKIPAGYFGQKNEEQLGFTAAQLDENQGGVISAFLNEGKQAFNDGTKTYTMPLAKSSEVMYYNKTFFENNNLQLPTHWFATTQNVDDDKTSMEYVCKRIREIDANSRPFGYDSDDNFFITLAAQASTLPENQGKVLYTQPTGNKYQFDNSVMNGLMKKFTEWYQNKYFITKGTLGNNAYTSDNFKNADGKLNQTYMCIGSTGGATYQVPTSDKFDVGIAEVPQLNPEQPRVILQGPNLCILKNKNNSTPDQFKANWLFVKYMMTSIPFQSNFSMVSGYVPVLAAVQDDDYYQEYLNVSDELELKADEKIAAMAVNQCLKYVEKNSFFPSPAFDGSSQAREEMKTLVPACLQLSDSGAALEAAIKEKFQAAINNCEFYNPSSK